MAIDVPSDHRELDLPISGLCFESNNTTTLDSSGGWFSTKIASSRGPLISDFVTHEPGFSYSTYGIHVGQDDRLTFLGENGKRIIGYFIDCRIDSPTSGRHVEAEFAPSAHRKLIIPRGVAHSFDNLEYIVTRDEPVWYSDNDNPAWNVDNDLISFSRATPAADAPRVRANQFLLTADAHLFMSRLSQSLLSSPKAYLNRFQVQVQGAKHYIALEPKDWLDDEQEVLHQLQPEYRVAGVTVQKNRYALTGRRSWTLVPNTESCVCDILLLPPAGDSDTMFCHARTRKIYTFLDKEGADVEIVLFDARARSQSEAVLERLKVKADPRVSVVIPHGVAYRFVTSTPLVVRCEHTVFVDKSEPRTDIPMFNQDLIVTSEAALREGMRITVPEVQCPGSVVYQLARVEVADGLAA